MKISIENFKSINKVQEFEIKPLTVLSGVNSAGKSSFIQILLLLKQSMDLKAENNPLELGGELYKASSFTDLVSNHNINDKIKVSFQISKEEYNKLPEQKTTKFFSSQGNYHSELTIHFAGKQDKILISWFELKFVFQESGEVKQISFNHDENLITRIENNNPTFIDSNLTTEDISDIKVDYISIFPNQISYKQSTEKDDIGNGTFIETQELHKVVNIHDTKNVILNFFEKMYYIGPSRKEPEESYSFKKDNLTVGRSGEFTSQILKEKASVQTDYFEIDAISEGGIKYIKKKGQLLESVNYWICTVFKMAKKIWAEERDGTYIILLQYENDLIVNIKHVGFGISQLLPIVVQGLLMPSDGTLIIEQPEIHLHPKIQSRIYDFLYSLTLLDKRILVETHSSHFITRMRRRIAEDMTNEMDDRINLTFIEDSIFRTLEIDDYGTILNYYPKDFIEHPSREMRAIVQAQVKKRKDNE